MKQLNWLILIGLGISGQVWAQDKCEDAADMSDGDIEAFHDCDHSGGALNQFLSGQSRSNAAEPNSKPQVPADPTGSDLQMPERRTIKQAYLLDKGPSLALSNLYARMAKACPEGWEKHREWVEADGSQYYLHFEYSCRQAD